MEDWLACPGNACVFPLDCGRRLFTAANTSAVISGASCPSLAARLACGVRITSAELLQIEFGPRQLFGVSRTDGDPRPFGRQLPRHDQAKPTGPAGHEDNPVAKADPSRMPQPGTDRQGARQSCDCSGCQTLHATHRSRFPS